MSKTSQGACVRFCKSLGYDGMKSLKNALFNEINNAKEEADENAIEFSDIHECSSISAIAKNVCNSSASAIHMTYQLLDESLEEKVAELVIHARSIRLFGLGASCKHKWNLFPLRHIQSRCYWLYTGNQLFCTIFK